MRGSRPMMIRGVLVIMAALLAVTPPAARAQRPLGTDVSSHEPNVNWTTVKSGGVTFAWTKATEGVGYVNPDFAAQELGAQQAGIYIGAYHFARPSDNPNITGANSADSEANYFWGVASNYVKYGGSYLVPMLDWEDTGVSDSTFTADELTAWANEWCAQVTRLALTNGVVLQPVIYTGGWYSNPTNGYPGLTTAITNFPDWISDYPSAPNPQTGSPAGYTYPWPSWNIWQYSDTNNYSAGDSDVYNGALPGFIKTFLVGGTNAPYFVSPTNITAAQGAGATFSVSASGVSPLSFQWYFNGAPIAGATSSNYTIASVQLANVGAYSVLVTNVYAMVPSAAATLSVIAPQTNAPGSVLAPPGMVNWWPAAGNANDIFGTNNAVPYGGVSYVTGKVGQAFEFNDSSTYLLVNGATELAPNWTVCLWVNRSASPNTSAALMGDATYTLKLEQYKSTHAVGISKSLVGDYLFMPSYTAPAGVWTHLAFVATSASVALYTNGVYEGATNVSGFELPRACIGANQLANGSPTDIMLGGVDELQVYSTALTAAQIKSIYTAGSAGLVSAPQFTGLSASSAGLVELNMQGQTGKTFSIYSSTDLVNWSKVATVANPSGALQYQNTPGTPFDFYMISQP